jgi:hypothetical protein
MANPESLAIKGQDLDGGFPFVTEDKNCPRKGILLHKISAKSGQPIDSPAEIHRFYGKKDLTSSADLKHNLLRGKP